MFSVALLAAAGATLVHAQNVYNIVVGGEAGNVYTPNMVHAVQGDIVRFEFHFKNHTVTQSTFDTPCVRIADTYGTPTGFATGFVPVPADATEFPTHEYTVEDTNPRWFYCGQGNHCETGMVFAINPNEERTFDHFRQNALDSPQDPPPSTTASSESEWHTPEYSSVVTVTATVTLDNGQWYTTTYGSYPGSPDPTPEAAPVTHEVLVGEDGLSFTPPIIEAAVNDVVTFIFKSKNHTVTQSTFSAPCVSLASTDGETGFDSGFRPVPQGATEFPSFSLTINDTRPIWGYCRQGNHCGQGMLFAINSVETTDNNFANFKELARRTSDVANQPPSNSSDTAAPPANTNNNSAATLVDVSMGLVGTVLAGAIGLVMSL